MNRPVTYRKQYRKLSWPQFHTARPYTGSDYYTVGKEYDHYWRKEFLFTGVLVRKVAEVKLKDFSDKFIMEDVDPPNNTRENFYKMMEKMYKENYFRPTFWKGEETVFQQLWFKKIDILARWA
jgi:hypothetical protein